MEARTLGLNNGEELEAWCGGRIKIEYDALDWTKSYPGINVPTRNGVERAQLGDTIIKHSDGTFEVSKNDNS